MRSKEKRLYSQAKEGGMHKKNRRKYDFFVFLFLLVAIHTPLSINSVINCAKTHPKKVISTPGQSTEEDIAADDYEVSVIPPETSTSGATYARNVSSVCNWEKERAKLF